MPIAQLPGMSAVENTASANSSASIATLIAVLLGAAIGAAGASAGTILYLARAGRMEVAAAATKPAEAHTSDTKDVTLEPILVNLADHDGAAYLRVAITLRVEKPQSGEKTAKEESSKPPNYADVRDAILSVLSACTSDQLQQASKEPLKKQLLSAVQQRNPKMKVHDVFFTDFLVQR